MDSEGCDYSPEIQVSVGGRVELQECILILDGCSSPFHETVAKSQGVDPMETSEQRSDSIKDTANGIGV